MTQEPSPSDGTMLVLRQDGWEMRGGTLDEPLPVSVVLAYEISKYNQRVLDETRKKCGEIRFAAKKSKPLAERLERLRTELRDAQAEKARRESLIQVAEDERIYDY